MIAGGPMPPVLFRTRRANLSALALLASAAMLPTSSDDAFAATAAPLLNHQAVYDLSLKTSRRSPSVDSVRGRIAYSFAGTACEGYTTDFRQVSQIGSGDGKQLLSDMRSSSWEEAEGKTFRFRVETRTNDAAPVIVEGTAQRGPNGVIVAIKSPRAQTATFAADTVFPTQQIGRILAAAKEGKSLLKLNVFDGSDTGQKLYTTLTVIGQGVPGDRPPTSIDPTSDNATMKTVMRWPITVSYYDSSKDTRSSGEQAPVYSMSFELYENGVSRGLSLDYNDFVVSGAMSKLDVKDAKPCNK
jgi:hypothetical protein